MADYNFKILSPNVVTIKFIQVPIYSRSHLFPDCDNNANLFYANKKLIVLDSLVNNKLRFN